jgi:spermidine synthase
MPRCFAFSAFLLGFTSLLIQIVVARELLTSFLGNEISIALVLLVWLILVAVGSALGSRLLRDSSRAARAIPWANVALVPGLLGSVWVAQAAGGAGRFPGEVIGPATMVLLSAAALAAPCLLLGALFAALCQVAEGESGTGSVAAVYALEAVGAVVAGALFHFAIADHLRSSETAILVGAADVAGASWVWCVSRKPGCFGAGLLAAATLVAAAVACRVFSPADAFRCDRGLAERWRTMEVVTETNSRYGNIAVVRGAGQITFYEAGLPAFTTQAVQANEIEVHTPLLMHPDPKRVLMISGGLGGGLLEVLKHDVERVDYIEMDRKLVDVARVYLPPRLSAALDDPRVRLHYADGRSYVKACRTQYDVILILVPDPATTALSRYYTLEFFAELERILRPSGIACIGLTAAQAKLSGPRLHLHATIYRALRDVFPAILPVPGEMTQYLAARSEELLSPDPAILMRRIRDRRLALAFVNDAWLSYALSPFARDMLLRSLASAEDVLPNRDSRPVSCHYWLRMWLSQLAPRAAGWLQSAERIVAGAWFLLPLGLLLSFALWRHPALPQFGAGLCIWGTGFLEMGAQVALILSYQAVAGYLYHQIGILMSLFMLGLAAGAALGRRGATKLQEDGLRRTGTALLTVVALQVASALCLPLLFAAGRASPGLAGLVFGGAAAWMGTLAGLNFPLAVSLAADRRGQEARAASRLYALDLVGASVAALLIGALAIPAVGITSSCRALAAVMLGSVPPLLAAIVRGRRQRA